MSAASTDVVQPKPFGRYLLHRQLATGGMGAVYLARLVGQQGFDKWVAVKTVHPHVASDPSFLKMFAREARLCARLDHPNVCQVFDYGDEQGTPFLAMEFLKGEPLSAVMRNASRSKQPVPFAVAARIIADAARGLHAAHELTTSDGRSAEVVHRDVSPQNLFVLYSGITKVVDFGVARWQDTLSEQTRSGMLRGKLAYMSPEQASAERVDRRTDVFALGVVLWELLTGTRLFAGESEAHTLKRVLLEPIRSPRELRHEVPEALAQVTLRALARTRDERFQSAEQLARELERWLALEAMGSGASEVARFMAVNFEASARSTEELLRAPLSEPVRGPTSQPAPPLEGSAPDVNQGFAPLPQGGPRPRAFTPTPGPFGPAGFSQYVPPSAPATLEPTNPALPSGLHAAPAVSAAASPSGSSTGRAAVVGVVAGVVLLLGAGAVFALRERGAPNDAATATATATVTAARASAAVAPSASAQAPSAEALASARALIAAANANATASASAALASATATATAAASAEPSAAPTASAGNAREAHGTTRPRGGAREVHVEPTAAPAPRPTAHGTARLNPMTDYEP